MRLRPANISLIRILILKAYSWKLRCIAFSLFCVADDSGDARHEFQTARGSTRFLGKKALARDR